MAVLGSWKVVQHVGVKLSVCATVLAGLYCVAGDWLLIQFKKVNRYCPLSSANLQSSGVVF